MIVFTDVYWTRFVKASHQTLGLLMMQYIQCVQYNYSLGSQPDILWGVAYNSLVNNFILFVEPVKANTYTVQ